MRHGAEIEHGLPDDPGKRAGGIRSVEQGEGCLRGEKEVACADPNYHGNLIFGYLTPLPLSMARGIPNLTLGGGETYTKFLEKP
jgi:hypothetical protein